jgi:predicted phosphohydrolase
VKGKLPMTTTEITLRKKQVSKLDALWLGDLHLDKAGDQQRKKLYNTIHSSKSDCVIITGDIASARHLRGHLMDLSSACWPRPCYFTPGNHDYHGSFIAEVEMTLQKLQMEVSNFHFLNGKRLIPLGHNTCLIGHGGWADARAGNGQYTRIDSPDRHAIRDFQGMGRRMALQKMNEFGRESAAAIRKILPLALSRYHHVIIATHVPPFPTAVRFDNKPCDRMHLPHFSNLSAGLAILGIARAFPQHPQRRITILAGHAHSKCIQTILPNLTIRVGHARTGRPDVFELLNL